MNKLESYGWNDRLVKYKQQSDFNQHQHGRVTVVHKTRYEVVGDDGLYLCELSGNILYGTDSSDYPCTGDWVVFLPSGDESGIILDRLPREKTLYRSRAGAPTGKQAIAAHVDKVFIVQGLDVPLNVRRIERFMVQAEQQDIRPSLVLTKADLSYQKREINDSLEHLTDRLPVFTTSIYSQQTVDELGNYIRPGETAVFVGLSGAGKSTLINRLVGEELLRTSAVSDATGKGRHTSTRREMILLEGSGVLIDTPGIKLFGVTADDPDTLSDVLNISDFEHSCRFGDCTHTDEPGCAVLKAVAEGRLGRDVLESYHKLKREAGRFSSAEHERRRRDKSFGKMVKQIKKYKGI